MNYLLSVFHCLPYIQSCAIRVSFQVLKTKVKVHFYTEDFSQGVMVSCNGFFFLMLSVVKCRQITSTVINYHVGWTISRYVT